MQGNAQPVQALPATPLACLLRSLVELSSALLPQVPRRFIGTDAFQETPIVEITRPITKHNYLVSGSFG